MQYLPAPVAGIEDDNKQKYVKWRAASISVSDQWWTGGLRKGGSAKLWGGGLFLVYRVAIH